ncbi:hypothetical protein [uncultured Clostridium sp.]|uniref:hypothetical protein n=1 Tax=uncultured Clostridium sp. TaxID=59620 RepID=UPI0027DB5F7B|nr:hypothetical protein [uncultured Clostridium sp.]
MAAQKKDNRVKKTLALNPDNQEDSLILEFLEENNINYSKYAKKLMLKDIQDKLFYNKVGQISEVKQIEQIENVIQKENIEQKINDDVKKQVIENEKTVGNIKVDIKEKVSDLDKKIPSCYE